MESCNHVFIGRANGVHCTRCGLHLTAEEYAKRCNVKAGNALAEKNSTAPQKVPRKKKEVKSDE